MASTPLRNIRVSDERWEAWGSAANAAGVSITELITTSTDGVVSGSTSSGSLQIVPARAAETRPERKRNSMCPHRVPASAYCRVCDGG